MSNIVKGVASAMIVILIVLLLWIFFAYYRNSAFIDTGAFPDEGLDASTLNIPSGEYISEEKNIGNGLVESIIGEKENISSSEHISGEVKNNSGDIENEPQENIVDNTPDTIIEIPSKDNEEKTSNEQILISSDLQTSNQEKQEILSEIDEALQGLLEAVGKVNTVDETRLDATLDSEVGKP